MTEPMKDPQQLADKDLDTVTGGNFLPNPGAGIAAGAAQGGVQGGVLSAAGKAVKDVVDALTGHKPA